MRAGLTLIPLSGAQCVAAIDEQSLRMNDERQFAELLLCVIMPGPS